MFHNGNKKSSILLRDFTDDRIPFIRKALYYVTDKLVVVLSCGFIDLFPGGDVLMYFIHVISYLSVGPSVYDPFGNPSGVFGLRQLIEKRVFEGGYCLIPCFVVNGFRTSHIQSCRSEFYQVTVCEIAVCPLVNRVQLMVFPVAFVFLL